MSKSHIAIIDTMSYIIETQPFSIEINTKLSITLKMKHKNSVLESMKTYQVLEE